MLETHLPMCMSVWQSRWWEYLCILFIRLPFFFFSQNVWSMSHWGNLHHKGGRQLCHLWQSQHPSATKGLNNTQDGSTTSPYSTLIYSQTRCTEGQASWGHRGRGLELERKDKTAEVTLLSLHLEYSRHGNQDLTLGTVPNCFRDTEISVTGIKYMNLGTGLKLVTYFTG